MDGIDGEGRESEQERLTEAGETDIGFPEGSQEVRIADGRWDKGFRKQQGARRVLIGIGIRT